MPWSLGLKYKDLQSDPHWHHCQSPGWKEDNHLQSKRFCVETSFKYSENYVLSFSDIHNCSLISWANRQKPSFTKKEVSCYRYSWWGENSGQAHWEDDLIFFCPTSSADTDSEDLSFIHVLCQPQGDRLDYTCRKAIRQSISEIQ